MRRKNFPLVAVAAAVILSVCLSLSSSSAQTSRFARPDAAEAAARLWKEAEAGSGKALFNLASIYDRGLLPLPVDSLTGDTVTPLSLYRRAADTGYPAAISHLGFLLVEGRLLPADSAAGFRLMQRAADLGDPKAANNLAYFLLQHPDNDSSYLRARQLLERAADAGLPTGLAQLADIYRLGLGTDPDTLRATALYERAISAGLDDAQRKLVAMNGRRWLTLPPDSALTLGRRYYADGAATAAVILLERAAEAELPDALALLGDAYSRGEGVPYSYEASIEYYFRAARLGQPSAQFIIGELLDMFPDALRPYAPTAAEQEAVLWYDRAATAGVRDAATASRLLRSPR